MENQFDDDQPASADDELLTTASGGIGEAGMIDNAATAIKRIINGATADPNKVDDIPVFTKEEWNSSSVMWKQGHRNKGSSFYGGDPTKEHFKIVDTVEKKAEHVQKIKDSNGGISKENPGW